MRLARITSCFSVLALLGFALAQELPEPTLDLGAWAASTAALAAVIAAAVSFVKRNLIPLRGWRTVAASLVLGAVGGAVLHFTGHIAELLPALGHGASAGLLASGGWDALKGLLGGGSTSENSNTATDSARARLRG